MLALAACSDELACPEVERTIDHGVYGQVVYKQFDGPDTPFYDVLISVTEFGNPPTFRTRSDRGGFFELALPGGSSSYMICTDFAASPCSSFTLTTVVRMDLVAEQQTAVYWEENNFPDCR